MYFFQNIAVSGACTIKFGLVLLQLADKAQNLALKCNLDAHCIRAGILSSSCTDFRHRYVNDYITLCRFEQAFDILRAIKIENVSL